MKKILLFVLSLIPLLSIGQTTLSPGDIVILEFNGNGTDGFTFMPLVDLQTGTTINFTDYGWTGTAFNVAEDGNSPNGGGNMITYTAPSAITAGTLIRQNSANIGGSAFTQTAGWSYNYSSLNYIYGLNTGGTVNQSNDGILVFQGTPSAPSFIWGYHTGSWGHGIYLQNFWSELPSILTNGTNAVYFADLSSGDVTVDDGYYSGPKTSADAATWRSRVANSANWTTLASGTAPTLLYPNTYTVTVPTVAPTVTTQAVSAITAPTATGNGNVTVTGGANVTERGIYWSTTNGFADGAGTKVSTTGNWSTTGAFTQAISGLTAGTTYYVKAFATNSAGISYGAQVSFTTLTAGTFTGATNTDWNTPNNWASGSLPGASTDVTIPSDKTVIIGPTSTPATCNNLTVSGTLTIQSSASGTGSLIVSGTSTGTVNCERYMTGSAWHLVSPLAVGGSVTTFIQNTSNAIPLSGINYGMMDYNEITNAWNPYFTTATSGNFPASKGYGIRRNADGVVTFTGTLTAGTTTAAVTKGGTAGWNLIGNPYTSSIYMNTAANASYNFIATNSNKLDASYACLYLWDVATSTYKILGNSSYSGRDLGMNVFAPGQAFFVKALSAGSIEFNKNMQVGQTNTAFKAPALSVNWPVIALKATGTTTNSSAIITFNSNMTRGLDPTYDAGLLPGTNGLSVYTRLVEDNGVDFAIQCLPESYDNLIIPVGIDSKDGGEITFSAENFELPKNCKVMIEDKTTNSFTSLAEGGTYKTTVSAGSTSAGRFYIHTGANATTGIFGVTAETSNLKVYIVNDEIVIEGEVDDQAIATLYNLQGLKLHVNALQKGSLNYLPSSGLMKGIYLLTIQQNGKTVTKKLIKE